MGEIANLLFGTVREIVDDAVHRAKRKVMMTALEMSFIILSAILLIAGAVAFFMRYFPPDGVLVATGALLLYGALMVRWLK